MIVLNTDGQPIEIKESPGHNSAAVPDGRFNGRKVVESYDPATWPYPREEDAEREWEDEKP